MASQSPSLSALEASRTSPLTMRVPQPSLSSHGRELIDTMCAELNGPRLRRGSTATIVRRCSITAIILNVHAHCTTVAITIVTVLVLSRCGGIA